MSSPHESDENFGLENEDDDDDSMLFLTMNLALTCVSWHDTVTTAASDIILFPEEDQEKVDHCCLPRSKIKNLNTTVHIIQ